MRTLAALPALSSLSFAQPGMDRFPSAHGDTVVFACEGGLVRFRGLVEGLDRVAVDPRKPPR